MSNSKNSHGKINPINVQKHLSGIDYPASKQDVIDAAKNQKADNNVMKSLDRLPDRKYESPTDVSHEIGKLQ